MNSRIAFGLSLALIGGGACSHSEEALGIADAGEVEAEVDAIVPTSCLDRIDSATNFGSGLAVSPLGRRAFTPAVAARPDGAIVAWHDAGEDGADLRYAVLIGDCLVAQHAVADELESLGAPKRAAVAATDAGYVLAYQAMDNEVSVVRALWLSPTGEVLRGPESISDATRSAAMTSIAAQGDDVAFAWTDSQTHYFARRGPVEEVLAKPVGSQLIALGLINTPHIAIVSNGGLALAWSDGGPNSENRDVLLAHRELGGEFGASQNLSQTPTYMSTDVDVYADSDGSLDVVWAQMDSERVDQFEVEHARRDPSGQLGGVQRYGQLQSVAWSPSAFEGGGAVWHLGGPAGGQMVFAETPGADPQPILGEIQGGQAQLARQGNGDLVLAFVERYDSQVRIARRAGPESPPE